MTRLFMTAICFTLLGSFAAAQDLRLEQRETRKIPSNDPQASRTEAIYMTSELIGMVVKDKADKSLGEVKDLVMNARGEVLYLAVLPENANGNDDYALIPFSALNLAENTSSSTDNITYVTTVIEYDRFVEAPRFARDRIYSARRLRGDRAIFPAINSFWGIQGPRVGFGFDAGVGARGINRNSRQFDNRQLNNRQSLQNDSATGRANDQTEGRQQTGNRDQDDSANREGTRNERTGDQPRSSSSTNEGTSNEKPKSAEKPEPAGKPQAGETPSTSGSRSASGTGTSGSSGSKGGSTSGGGQTGNADPEA